MTRRELAERLARAREQRDNLLIALGAINELIATCEARPAAQDWQAETEPPAAPTSP